MSEDWDGARYEREKRNFVESRLQFRSVYLHTALIFTITWLTGWLFSWTLLKLGMTNMPLRYGVSFFFSYLAFLGCVRVWADSMRAERGRGDGGIGGFDAPVVDAEGCGVVLVGLLLGLAAAGLFAMMGGLPLLLEVAFEVVFAGVVVRRIARKERIGAWASRLLRSTWLPALLTLALLTALAAWLQAHAPGSQTFAEAVRIFWKR